ncbi:unnamed protein product, partial [Staurois parvus]
GSRSSSPGKLLGSGYSGLATSAQRVPQVPSTDKRSKIPRSQGCSRETSPSRLGLARQQPHSPTQHESGVQPRGHQP